MRVDQLLTTCSVLGRYYNREASDNMRNPKLIRGENAKKRGVEEGEPIQGNLLPSFPADYSGTFSLRCKYLRTIWPHWRLHLAACISIQFAPFFCRRESRLARILTSCMRRSCSRYAPNFASICGSARKNSRSSISATASDLRLDTGKDFCQARNRKINIQFK